MTIGIGIIAMWLLLSTIKKGVDELIELYMPNGFSDITKYLEVNIKEFQRQLEERKKELKSRK